MDLYNLARHQMSSNCQENFYLLLDQAGLPRIRNRISATSLHWKSLFSDTQESGAEVLGPLVIHAGNAGRLLASRSLLESIQERGRFRSVIVMISSPLSLGSLSSRLNERLDVTLAWDMRAMLRFYDPRVLEALTRTLDDNQRRWFFGIANGWWYFNRLGDIVHFDSNFAEASNKQENLCFTQAQEDALLRESEVDHILNILHNNFPDLMRTFSAFEQYCGAVNAIKFFRNEDEFSIHAATCRAAEFFLGCRSLTGNIRNN